MFKLFLSHVVNAMGETVPCIKNKMYRNRKLAFVLHVFLSTKNL